MKTKPIGLFQKFGIELEYMIVDRDTLEIKPVSDFILHKENGRVINVLPQGDLAWSNELVMHVLELKNPEPVPDLFALKEKTHSQIRTVNKKLEEINAMLLPTAMHPLARPGKNVKLWPGRNNEIYASYNRIFNCNGHGWFNVQSTHLNLPFANSAEFGRLHAAIRILLPILPGLAASSPIVNGKITGTKDIRLKYYASNQRKVPPISGKIIPEPVFTISDYKNKLLKNIYDAIAPYDPEGYLQYEWLNSRGAIARFERNAIEIRVLDIQEAPAADIAITTIIIHILRSLVQEKSSSYELQKQASMMKLHSILKEVIVHGENTIIKEPTYLQLLGISELKPLTVKDIWLYLIENHLTAADRKRISSFLESYRKNGSLSSRIIKTCGTSPSHAQLLEVYHELANCLQENRIFSP